MPAIAIDATPLTPSRGAFGGHAVRGIGRYVTSLLRSLASEAPDWTGEHLIVMRTSDVAMPWWTGEEVVTHRLRARPQDVAWFSAPVLDRLALGRRELAGWTTTDPTAPLRPPESGRSVVIAYDLIPLAQPSVMAQMRGHRRLVYRVYLRQLERADVVVCISRTVAVELSRRLRIPADRLVVVYPGLNAPSTPEPHDAGSPRDLLFVGVPAPHKNPAAAIAMLAELRRRGHQTRLRFAGMHFPQARRHLTDEAARQRVAGQVEYLDHVDDERLAQLYRTSTLVAPSTVEGLGLGPIEAILADGRAVCGPASVFRETLGDTVEYADPADPGDMADAYERTLSGGPSAAQRAALAERFSPAACASAAITAFERLRSSRTK